MTDLTTLLTYIMGTIPAFHSSHTLGLAVSGGADSMALAFLAKQAGFKVHAFTVDHGLRPDSATEATYVGQLMHRLHIPHTILPWQHETPLQNRIQERARQARYDLLAHACQQHDIKVLLTAHHLNDQIETFLMRLNHGSNLYGLQGMKPHILLESGIHVVRPFLTLSKQRLIDILQAADIPWVEDPSNTHERFERVRARSCSHFIKPDQFLKSLQKIQAVQTFMDDCVEKFLAPYPPNSMNRDDFSHQHPTLQQAIIKHILRHCTKKTYLTGDVSIEKLSCQFHDITFKGATLNGLYFYKKKTMIMWCPELRN